MAIKDILNVAKKRIGLITGPLLYNVVIIFGICVFLVSASIYWLVPVLRTIDQNISDTQYNEAANANILLNLFLDETFSHLIHFGEHAYDEYIDHKSAHITSESRQDFLNLSVFDTNGSLMLTDSRNSSQPAPFKSTDNVRESSFFQDTMKGQRYIGPVLLGSAGPTIQIAGALKKNGQIVGVATSEIDFSLLWEAAKNIQVKDGKTYLVDQVGTIISDPDINRTRSGENLRYRNVVNLMTQGREVVMRDLYVNEGGDRVIALGLKMKKTGWGIVVEKNEEKALIQKNNTLLAAYAFGVASVLLISMLILSTLRLGKALFNIEREKSERERTIAYLPDGVVEFTGENEILNLNAAAMKYLDITKPMPKGLYVVESGALPEGFGKLKQIFYQLNKTEGGQGNVSEVVFEEPERKVLQIITVYVKGSGPLKDQRYLKIIHDVTHER